MTREEILKVAKPILFNTEMVKAILNSMKTETRRLVKGVPENTYRVEPVDLYGDGTVYAWDFLYGVPLSGGGRADMHVTIKPKYQIGDYLYVRETWERFYCFNCDGDESGMCFNGPPDSREGCYVYRASHFINGDARWHPSIHMPKEAARLFLRVTDVRVERLQDITADGIRNEGLTSAAVHVGDIEIAKNEFALLWDSAVKIGDYEKAWNANPWVWVIRFERAKLDGTADSE